jgi:hypothetical protein
MMTLLMQKILSYYCIMYRSPKFPYCLLTHSRIHHHLKNQERRSPWSEHVLAWFATGLEQLLPRFPSLRENRLILLLPPQRTR